jgi:AraC-like DNA-binding protein
MQQFHGDKALPGKRIFLSTNYVAPELRNEMWRSALLPLFDPIEVDNQKDTGFQGTISVSKLGRLTIGQLTFNAQKNLYSQSRLCQNKIDGFLFQIFRSGYLEGQYNGKEVFVSPGDIIIRDIQRPATTQVTDGSTLLVIVPRDLLRNHIADVLHGLVLPAISPETRILTEFLLCLENQGEQVSLEAAALIEKAFVDLFEANVQSLECRSKLTGSASLVPLRDRIINFIDQNLDNAELGIDLLVKKFFVSRAHLYRVFNYDGGIAKFIQKRRLEAAYIALTNPRFANQSIEEIAFAHGFTSGKHFGRAFRSLFGVTPGSIRSQDTTNGILVRANDAYHHFEEIARQYSLLPR